MPIKMLFIGESGTGKTGAIASLLDAGYKVRMHDLDNGSDILVGPNGVLRGAKSIYKPDSISRLSVLRHTEAMHILAGRMVPRSATVWNKIGDGLTNWAGPDAAHNGEPCSHGSISTWGEDVVYVLDSLSAAARAGHNFHLQMNGRLAGQATGFVYQKDIGMAQGYVESLLQLLYDSSIKCNVVVLCHVVYIDDKEAPPGLPDKNGVLPDPPQKGFPMSVGKAIAERIPTYFNNMLQAKIDGQGPGARQSIYTKTQGKIALKTSAPNSVKLNYGIEKGLAEVFKDISGVAAPAVASAQPVVSGASAPTTTPKT